MHISKWWLLFPLAFALAVMTGSLLYLSSSYIVLKDWYLSLYPCIYRAQEWPQDFFTRAVKLAGDRYCLAAIPVALGLLLYLIRQLIRSSSTRRLIIRLDRKDAAYLAGLYLFGLAIWLHGHFSSYPAYDEVFSAVNCTGIHPFQAGSYYMLPNNHVFFNVLNALAAFFTDDKLLSGRILSGIAFAALILLLYTWLRRMTASPHYAALFCALMMLQFPAWGYSFQARGYSIYLLCSWASFIFLQRYLLTRNASWLPLHGLAVVIGFWTIPSFLYWEAALAIYLLFHTLRTRRIPWPAIRSQALAILWTFLAYLPLILFSGLAAIKDNRYVRIDRIPVTEYWPSYYGTLRSLMQYCFSGWVEEKDLPYLLLFFLPLAMLPFLRRSRIGGTVGFYVIMWLAFTGLMMYMQRFPFGRNLTAHVSLTLAAVLLASYAGMKRLLRQRWPALQYTATAIVCLAFGVHFAMYNKDHIHLSLYFYHADKRYHTVHNAVKSLPAGARVGLSNEGFYWEYLCRRRGLQATKCPGPDATHYIKADIEPLPPALAGRAEKIGQADEYEIYRIR